MTLVGTVALNKRFKAIKDTKPLLRQVQLATVREAKILVPRKTGFLGRSITPAGLTAREASVEVRANYAAFVEFGTRPHEIRPKNKKALAFAVGNARRLSGRARVGAAKVFAKVVHHPGTKPHPFLLPAARKAVADVTTKTIVDDWNGAA